MFETKVEKKPNFKKYTGFTYQKGEGFTLIELLVVIAIIGLLSSIVFASLDGARKKSRDAKRIAEVRQLINALDLYYADNDAYPQISAGGFSWAQGSCDSGSRYYTTLNTELVEDGYLSRLPVDPVNDRSVNPNQCYWYFTHTQDGGNCGSVDANLYEYAVFFSTESATNYNYPVGRAGSNGPTYCVLGPLK